MKPCWWLPIAVLSGAMTALERAPSIAAEPRSAAEFVQKGKSGMKQGDIDGAIAAFTEAIRLDPKFAEAYYNRGGPLDPDKMKPSSGLAGVGEYGVGQPSIGSIRENRVNLYDPPPVFATSRPNMGKLVPIARS